MAIVAVTAEQHIEAPPPVVFDLFGAGRGAGWVFDAECDRVGVGAVVTMHAPLGAATRPDHVDILGRIAAIDRPRSITVVHDLPWRGRLSCQFRPHGRAGTRVRLVAELDRAGMEWLMRRRGWEVAEPPVGGDHPLGLLTSKSGPGSVFAAATENLVRMAVEEINADGGIRGRPIRVVVGDDATDGALGALEARRLARAGCRAILVCTTSATFVRAARELDGSGVLLIHTVMNEGGLGDEMVVQLGERPAAQLALAVGPLMRAAGGRHWFLAGDDYRWPHQVHQVARQVLARHGGAVVGERFTPLGSHDFTPLIESILASGAELILSTFVGADAVAFERQCFAMGVRDRCRTLAPALDEPTRERIGDRAAAGVWAVSGYFQQLPSEQNTSFLTRYSDAYGRWACPVSSISESTYEAVHLYAAAVRAARDADPRAVARELRGRRSMFPRGPVTVADPETVQQDLYLAEAGASGFELVDAPR